MAWGEPAIPTAVSTVQHGRLYYRGQDAIALARRATLEEAAALLWEAQVPVVFAPAPGGARDAFVALAALVPESESILGRSRERLCRDAGQVVGLLLSAAGCAATDAPAHDRLARRWGLDETGAARIRQALVAMADHDLNTSTFAARVAASTGASMAANVLAGLCALSGPKHGGASGALLALLHQAEQAVAMRPFQDWLDRGAGLPGFDHPLYPGGDPRGALMLENLALDPLMLQIRDLAADRAGQLPNCDFALAALVRALALPPEAPFILFMIGRSVGWCAHAMEQSLQGQLIRPRGRYIGTPPRA